MTDSKTTRPAESTTRDARWLALIVLCAGFMMIILDSTIVNVALPSIQADLGFTQSTLAWVVNGYLIAFGGLLLLSGRLGDLIGRRRVFLFGLVLFTAASLACGFAVEPGDPGRRALHPGDRRRADLRRDPRHDRDDVPRAAGAGQGDRHLQLRGLRGRLDRPAGRRRADPGDQLALDLLRQRPDRRRDRAAGAALRRGRRGPRPRQGRRRPRRAARDRCRSCSASTPSSRSASTAGRRSTRSRSAPPRSRCWPGS